MGRQEILETNATVELQWMIKESNCSTLQGVGVDDNNWVCFQSSEVKCFRYPFDNEEVWLIMH